jgi:hypothetical protein
MKKIMFSLFILSILFTIGCEDEKETSDTNPLVGVYNMTSISNELQTDEGQTQTLTYNHDGTDNYLVLVLGDDGVYSSQGKIDGYDISILKRYSEGGTWSDTGNKLTLIPSDGGTDIFDFTLTGNNLVMTLTFPETNDEYGYVMTYNFTKE